MENDGIPWLTGRQRDFLAHLTTLTIQRQLKPERSYQRVSEALVDLPPGGGHRGYAAVVDGSGLMVACCCSHSMGGR
jgi:hypothetical protein